VTTTAGWRPVDRTPAEHTPAHDEPDAERRHVDFGYCASAACRR
jgi:hypothetical protein